MVRGAKTGILRGPSAELSILLRSALVNLLGSVHCVGVSDGGKLSWRTCINK